MAELFHKTFAADLSEFDSTTASNGTIAQSAGAGLNETTGGVLCTRTANSPNLYGQVVEDFTGKSFLRTAFFLDVSALTIGTNDHNFRLYELSDGGGLASWVRPILRSGVLSVWHYLYNDVGGFVFDEVVLGTPEWMELRVKRASGSMTADGESQLYFGGGSYAALGELVSELTGVINYTRFEKDDHYLGMRVGSASVGGALKFDEWTMRDDDTPILYGVSASTFSPLTWLRRRRR